MKERPSTRPRSPAAPSCREDLVPHGGGLGGERGGRGGASGSGRGSPGRVAARQLPRSASFFVGVGAGPGLGMGHLAGRLEAHGDPELRRDPDLGGDALAPLPPVEREHHELAAGRHHLAVVFGPERPVAREPELGERVAVDDREYTSRPPRIKRTACQHACW